jgi:predicted transcriptional regulator
MGMVDLDFNEPVPLMAEEDQETLAAIDRGLQAADEGRTVSVDEAREMISQWIAKSASPKTR